MPSKESEARLKEAIAALGDGSLTRGIQEHLKMAEPLAPELERSSRITGTETSGTLEQKVEARSKFG